ncbi:beta-phosphoglucomutase [Bacteroidia bacterium]|nr:beta-phosphoglucomutase [Bacteroidia bacterium]GHT04141.1 beta-phosphoglucomutase [Bacteroidia bacterium]GHT50424.1 beta-phosphoglucomutase [Bacteroidia bacterium]
MIKAVLFDMDGVLYDSMPGHVQAWYDTMSSVGVMSLIEEYYLHEGRTGHATINILFNQTFGRNATPEEIKTLYEKKTKRFVELEHPEAQPMPGAWEVLQKVKDLGLQRIIVTGSGQKSLFDKIDKHYPGFFDKKLMVTAYDVKYGKPHPEPYLMGLQKGNLLSGEAIIIENAPLGIESGRAAGIYTVAVNTGPLPDKVLWDAGANAMYPSMKALANNIENLISSLDKWSLYSIKNCTFAY